MGVRPFTATAMAALVVACGAVRPLTQADRENASRAAQEKAPGAILTEAEISKMDLDRTFVCEFGLQVGSHIPHYQCRSLRRIEREREVAHAYVSDEPGGALRGNLPSEVPNAKESSVLRATLTAAADGGTPTAPAPNQDPRFPPL